MKLIEKKTIVVQKDVRRKTDDLQNIVTVTMYQVTVLDESSGIQYTLPLFDHDPTPAEIYAVAPSATFLTPSSKADWARAMSSDFTIWQFWKTVRAEAISRGLGAAVLAALQGQENAAWSALAADIIAWNNAS